MSLNECPAFFAKLYIFFCNQIEHTVGHVRSSEFVPFNFEHWRLSGDGLQPGRGHFLFYWLGVQQVLKDADVTVLEDVNKAEGFDETCRRFHHSGGPAVW